MFVYARSPGVVRVQARSGAPICARDGWGFRGPEVLELWRQSLWKSTKKQFKWVTFDASE